MNVHRQHEADVIDVLAHEGALSRAAISDLTGLGRAAVSDALIRLAGHATVVVRGLDTYAGRGRPTELLALDDAAVSAIGIDLAHGATRILALNITGGPLHWTVRQHDEDLSWAERSRIVDELFAELAIPAEALRALRSVAIGIPGPATIQRRRVTLADLSPATDDALSTDAATPADATPNANPTDSYQRLVVDIARRFSVPILLENTTRFAAYAEHLALTGADESVTLHVRCFHGVGGAIVASTGAFRGARGMAGEVGHLPVRGADEPCRCGRRGCLETIASLPAILGHLADAGLPLTSGDELCAAHNAGEPRVHAELKRAGTAIGEVLVEAASLIDPTQIVICGPAADCGTTLLDAATAAFHEGATDRFDPAPIRRGVVGDIAGVWGAALSVLHHEYPELLTSISMLDLWKDPQ